jgi:hypothetical protein
MAGFGDFAKKEKKKKKKGDGQKGLSAAPVFTPPTIVKKGKEPN